MRITVLLAALVGAWAFMIAMPESGGIPVSHAATQDSKAHDLKISAMVTCNKRLEKQVNHPDSIDYDPAYVIKANVDKKAVNMLRGFTAKNSFGAAKKFHMQCFVVNDDIHLFQVTKG